MADSIAIITDHYYSPQKRISIWEYKVICSLCGWHVTREIYSEALSAEKEHAKHCRDGND